jgi:SCY1-like protein 2
MVPFVLPVVLQISEEASNPDFVQYILPELKPVMKMTDPIQVRTYRVSVGLAD